MNDNLKVHIDALMAEVKMNIPEGSIQEMKRISDKEGKRPLLLKILLSNLIRLQKS